MNCDLCDHGWYPSWLSEMYKPGFYVKDGTDRAVCLGSWKDLGAPKWGFRLMTPSKASLMKEGLQELRENLKKIVRHSPEILEDVLDHQ